MWAEETGEQRGHMASYLKLEWTRAGGIHGDGGSGRSRLGPVGMLGMRCWQERVWLASFRWGAQLWSRGRTESLGRVWRILTRPRRTQRGRANWGIKGGSGQSINKKSYSRTRA